MASTEQELRREVGAEREKLAEAVGTLRSELGAATDIRGKLRAKLPIAAAGAAGLGLARLLVRRVRSR